MTREYRYKVIERRPDDPAERLIRYTVTRSAAIQIAADKAGTAILRRVSRQYIVRRIDGGDPHGSTRV